MNKKKISPWLMVKDAKLADEVGVFQQELSVEKSIRISTSDAMRIAIREGIEAHRNKDRRK